MNHHKKLDLALTAISNHDTLKTLSAEEICTKANLKVNSIEAGLIVDKLRDDGYVRRMDSPNSLYIPKYSGKIFLDNGGYEHQHFLYKREQRAKLISDYTNMVIKPVSVITVTITAALLLIKLYGFLFT